MQVITSEKAIIKLWLDYIEEGALQQARNMANLPFVFKHIAIMPDSHQGYGMPIGGVMATQGVVVPNAVGVDIGCGMVAVKTSIQEIDRISLMKIIGGSAEFKGGIRSMVPTGFGHHSKKQDECYMPDIAHMPETSTCFLQYEAARKQVGTLGGGNHFIEIQKDEDGFVWLMIHSGSRNLGFSVANRYNDLANALNEKWRSSVPKAHQLAFLPLDSQEGLDYMNEMEYCVKFAYANRRLMMGNVMHCVREVMGNVSFGTAINIAHNYAAMEHHFGTNVLVHRKGATRAYNGELGIIPGSQGAPSYIVVGKGDPDSFMSCSHGAGRKMGRKEACRILDFDTEVCKLNEDNIIHSVRTVKQLDEAPGAYKDIGEVMANQTDLVMAMTSLRPLAVIKG